MANPITPETRVHLLSVPLESNMKATLYFASKSAQETYFLSKAVKSNTDFTYQRKDKSMVVPYLVDTLYQCNYVMYQNHNFNNKWFYAFITKMEYVDEETTRLYIETDPIQTWWFDLTFKQSFVEREHVSDDTLGLHTIPEGLEGGEYIVNSHIYETFNIQTTIVTGSVVTPGEAHDHISGVPMRTNEYNGIPTPIIYCRWDREDVDELSQFLNDISYGKMDEMLTMFLAPTWLCPLWEDPANDGHIIKGIEDPRYPNHDVIMKEWAVDRISSLDSYVPHNKKLLCYPYCYIGLSNSVGQYNIVRQENWEADDILHTMTIRFYGALTPGCSIKAFPYKYQKTNENLDESISIGKFPTLAWASDLYTNWQTVNGINVLGYQVPYSVAQIGMNTFGGILGALNKDTDTIINGLGGIFGAMQEMYQKNIAPIGVNGSINSGDVLNGLRQNCLHIYRMTIKNEYAKIIDKYFDMYGYKVNETKVPNKNHRKNYWYTKTIDCNIVGDIPEEDMEAIKNCFNNGITFWKNPANMYDYSVDNSIV